MYRSFGECLPTERNKEEYPQRQKLNRNGTWNQCNHSSWSVMIVLMGWTSFPWFNHISIPAVETHFLSQMLAIHARDKAISEEVILQQEHCTIYFTASYIPQWVCSFSGIFLHKHEQYHKWICEWKTSRSRTSGLTEFSIQQLLLFLKRHLCERLCVKAERYIRYTAYWEEFRKIVWSRHWHGRRRIYLPP